MTNAMIVFVESIRLMEEGKLQSTGEKVIVETSDGKKEYDVPEPIHTYQRWKSMGYRVKRGSKAVAQFPIWKYTSKKDKDMSEEEAQESGFCFMKQSSWFSASQVEKVTE